MAGNPSSQGMMAVRRISIAPETGSRDAGRGSASRAPPASSAVVGRNDTDPIGLDPLFRVNMTKVFATRR